MGAVAPPPAPRVVTAPPMEPTPGPPPRAALYMLPPGRPPNSTELVPPVARFAEIPAVVGDSAKPDVGDDSDGDSVVVEVPELTSPAIATALAAFIKKLGTAGQWVGISAFILSMYRLTQKSTIPCTYIMAIGTPISQMHTSPGKPCTRQLPVK